MISSESIVDEFCRIAQSASLTKIGQSEADSENVAQVKFVDSRGSICRFETNGEKYRLCVADFEFLEFEYDDAERISMAHDLARVAKAVLERNYTSDKRGNIEVVIYGRYYGGLRGRQGCQ